MASATARVDDFVKDYLLFRGCTSTLRVFENELKTDKEKALRVMRIDRTLFYRIYSYSGVIFSFLCNSLCLFYGNF